MSCVGCESAVVSALSGVPGVREVEASFEARRVTVRATGDVADRALVEALGAADYAGRVIDDAPVATDGATEAGDAPAVRRGGGEYDLAVLGAGSAGFAAAIRAAAGGARVALISHGTIGGTCVNVGCIPSKALIRAAEAHHRGRFHGFEGVPTSNGTPDWGRIRSQKDALVGQLRQAKYVDVLRSYPTVTLVEARGEVEEGGAVRLSDGSRIDTDRVVVTTGSSPGAPEIPGLAEAGHLDSTTAMALDELPSSMVVLGAGSVGLELGQAFARLGVDVTILSRRNRVLSREDPEIGRALMEYLTAEGIVVRDSVSVDRVERRGRERIVQLRPSDGKEAGIRAEQVLVATGRRPNVERLGLEEAGVELGPGGEVLVDEFLRTANPRIFAAGDVTGEPMHVYVAAHAAALAAENALAGDGRQTSLDLRVLPRVTFTDPAVASVGLTDDEARQEGLEPVVALLPLEHVPRALAARDTRGFIKLVADARSRRILGAHILAAEAGEMIMEPTLAVKLGLTIEELIGTLHPYLTLGEGIRLAAQTFDKEVSALSCCAA